MESVNGWRPRVRTIALCFIFQPSAKTLWPRRPPRSLMGPTNGPQEWEAIASARELYSDGPSIFQLVLRFNPNQVLEQIFEIKWRQHFEGRRGFPLARTGALQSQRCSQTVSVMDILWKHLGQEIAVALKTMFILRICRVVVLGPKIILIGCEDVADKLTPKFGWGISGKREQTSPNHVWVLFPYPVHDRIHALRHLIHQGNFPIIICGWPTPLDRHASKGAPQLFRRGMKNGALFGRWRMREHSDRCRAF